MSAGKIVLQEADLDTVLRYYAKAFNGAPEIIDTYVDVGRRVVVFKLYVPPKPGESHPEPKEARDG